MDGNELARHESGEPQEGDAITGGFGRGRFLAAAGGAAIGLTAAFGGWADTASAAVAGPYFKPDEFFKEGELERSAAIIKADEKAAEAGGYVLFGPGTYPFKKTLRFSAPWVGVPRRTVLEAQAGFVYEKVEGSIEQFVAMNAHFARSFSGTADSVLLEGIDWLINTDSGSAGKGSIGLANVSGGAVRDCGFSTSTGTPAMGALLDLYACVHGLEVDRVRITNLTKGSAGVGLNVRNLAKVEPPSEANNTERIVVRDSYVGTSTADEAIAIYGVLGLTTNVRVIDTTVVALSSTQQHARIASTFPFSNGGANTHAGVEDVEWRGCRFIDTSGSLKESGNLLAFGQTGDEKNICQNIRAVDCGFVIRTASAQVVAIRNVVNGFEGASSGNYLANPRLNAVGSTAEVEVGIFGFTQVQNPVLLGNLTIGLRSCERVLGGAVEAMGKSFYGCGEVASVAVKLLTASATACYHDSKSVINASMRGCLVEGGQRLVQTAEKLPPEESRIDIAENQMITSATSGEVASNSSHVRLRLRGNTLSGSVALKFPEFGFDKTTHTQSIINDWYGTLEGV
jgi:hypothetical protein